MLLFVVGMPGVFAGGRDAIVRKLAERALGPTETIVANSLEDIALSIIRSGHLPAVISSRRPGGHLRAALIDHRQNFVVALDDPLMALADLVLGEGIELAAATQSVASSCAAIAPLADAPGALTLRGHPDWLDENAAVLAIAEHLELPIGEAEALDITQGLGGGAAADARRGAAMAWWAGLAPAQRELAEGSLAPYIGPAGREPLRLRWGRELFFLGDGSGARLTAPVDITGRARCLVYGPDIMLEPGSWLLALSAWASREAAEHDFLVEVFADDRLSSATLRPPQEGAVEVHLSFALDRLTERPVTLRISSLRAAFDGALALIEARFVRAP